MIKAILIDIEGTVAPISFVKDVLFPYSKERLEKFLEENKENPHIKRIVEEIKKIEGKDLSLKEAVNTLKKWIDEDRKIAPLKDIQGFIWKEGFEKGDIKSPIYEDAYKKLKEWKEKGLKLYIYSSGSVQAQKLFFSHTEHGNLLDLFDGFFDTRIGNKKEKDSYVKIAQKIGLKPEEILFLSDNPDEIKAAAQAGMKVYRIVRPEDAEFIDNFPFRQVKDFNGVKL
ncbi:enolase-phosphatase E1 [Persephonella hydrogeniphila]|uniref:Enolase-phosphatase E1 n=1 Tax=Persephonella hydrogeniphila TaxID=198703 RepID=A0A285N161_9AQUI|nr:acireductone synthase [Persephonella hydrogeniphila]SNZ03204.1 enolase-phosphatase E1 [Persephonella hydrogeniphila]